MTSYKLQAIIPPSLVAREKKEQRQKVLEAVRARRAVIYKRYQEKLNQLSVNAETTEQLQGC